MITTHKYWFLELSESEQLLLVGKKEEISKITSELLTNSELSKSEKISKMNEILSLLSTIESYANMHRDMNAIQKTVIMISYLLDFDEEACGLIKIFCTAVNTI